MSPHPLSGVYAAAVTPLKADFSPDLDAVAPFLAFLASRGCHGALIFGTTGEGPSFSSAERTAVWEAALRVREQYPHFRLLAGVGTPSMTETIELTKLAFDLGYEAVLALPPYYFRNASEEGLFRWFEQVIRRSVPRDGCLLGYHFPAVAGVGFSLDLLARLKDAFPEQFAGLKDSSHDRAFAHSLGERFGFDLVVFSGTDSDLTFALEHRAAGCITAAANLISPGLREVYEAFMRGQETSALQEKVTQQRHVLEAYPPFPPAIKALLSRLHHWPRWPVRPPLVAMPPQAEERLVREFSAVA